MTAFAARRSSRRPSIRVVTPAEVATAAVVEPVVTIATGVACPPALPGALAVDFGARFAALAVAHARPYVARHAAH